MPNTFRGTDVRDCHSLKITVSRRQDSGVNPLWQSIVGEIPYGPECLGRLIVKTQPVPGRLRTYSFPPLASQPRCAATPRCLIETQSPRPFRLLLRWTNGRTSSSRGPDGSPPHSSSISIRT